MISANPPIRKEGADNDAMFEATSGGRSKAGDLGVVTPGKKKTAASDALVISSKLSRIKLGLQSTWKRD